MQNGQATGDAHHRRLQCYVLLYDQHKSLWTKFYQLDSTERRALLSHSQDEGMVVHSEDADMNANIAQFAWRWLERKTAQPRQRIENDIWIGRNLKAMVQVLGDGVLYFMDKRLEIQ